MLISHFNDAETPYNQRNELMPNNTTPNTTPAVQNVDMKKVALFQAGTRTDSSGRTKVWTTDELDTIVANFNARNPEVSFVAPATVGHPDDNTYPPKDTAPAYGWLAKAWVEGDIIYGDFREVNPEFAQKVELGQYPNRSINITREMSIGHVAFLGAVLPAVEGMPNVQFKVDKDKSHNWNFADEVTTPVAASPERTARSAQYKISVIADRGYDLKPAHLTDLTDDQFGDPVNYRFPLTEEFAESAMRNFSKKDTREQYSEPEQQLIMQRMLSGLIKNGLKIPEFWMYKADKKGITISFADGKGASNSFIHVPADVLNKKQLVDYVNGISQAPAVSAPAVQTQPNNLVSDNLHKQEFAQMITVEQVLAEIKKYSDTVSGSQTPEVATAIMAEVENLNKAISDMFAADAAANPPADAAATNASADTATAVTPTPQPQPAPSFKQPTDTEKILLARLEVVEKRERMRDYSEFAKSALEQGRILPAQVDLVVELLEATSNAGTFNFSKGGKMAVHDGLKNLVLSTKQFDFAAQATAQNAGSAPASTNSSPGDILIQARVKQRIAEGQTSFSYGQGYTELCLEGVIS